MGLFGLTMYTTQRRTKEIGIRKVHGAASMNIVMIIVKDISFLIGISTLIAWAASYIITTLWLEGFAYRIDLNPLFFIAGAGIAFIIAIMTVSIQTFYAAQINPAQSLHYE